MPKTFSSSPLAMVVILLLPWALPGQADFQKIDKHAQKAPENLTQNLSDLTAYLTEPAQDELRKVRSIYAWIIFHISYDQAAYQDGQRRINQNIADILRRRKGVCFDYATLFSAMCRLAGIPAAVISGYSKGTLTARPDLEEADHAWNAVQIDSVWYLLDATWDASLLDKSNTFTLPGTETYFLADPADFVLSHLPNLPMWQLLPCPVSTTIFSLAADSIRQYIRTSQPCLAYTDTIDFFFSLSPEARLLYEAEQTFRFNPSQPNRRHLGHSLIDYAGLLADQTDSLQTPHQLDSLIILQHEILQYCQRATELTSFYPWQSELFINTLLNQAVALYQKADQVKQPRPLFRQALEHLTEAEQWLINLDNSYFANYARRQCAQIKPILQEMLEKE